MSDTKSLHQRIKKFSKLFTKVKEKAQNVFHEEEGEDENKGATATTMTRRHSSYTRQPINMEESNVVNFFDRNNTRLKQEDYYHTIPPHHHHTTNNDNITNNLDTSCALSPPPRHLKKDRQKSLNSINYQNRYSSPQIAAKPCLSRSNTLGHHPTTTTTTTQLHTTLTPPDLSSIITAPTHHTSFSSSNSSTSLSSLSGRCDNLITATATTTTTTTATAQTNTSTTLHSK